MKRVREIQTEQGWTDATLLNLAPSFIEETDNEQPFREYLVFTAESAEEDTVDLELGDDDFADGILEKGER